MEPINQIFTISLFFLPIVLTCLSELLFKSYLKEVEPIESGHWSRISGVVLMIIGIIIFTHTGLISFSTIIAGFSWNSQIIPAVLLSVILSTLAGLYISKKVRSVQIAKGIMFPFHRRWEYLAVWILYLFFYEIYFRQFLFPYAEWGLLTALIFNLVLYSLAHVHKGVQQAFACIPFGVLLCLVTLFTHNLWASFLGHFALAFSDQFIGPKYFQFKWKISIIQLLNSKS